MIKDLPQETNDEINSIIESVARGNGDDIVSDSSIDKGKEEKKEEYKKEEHSENDYNKIEREARLRGWKPKEEYEGEIKGWRSAEEFLEVGKIYDEQKSKKLETELKELREELRGVRDLNVKQALKLAKEKSDYLKNAKNQAIQEGDVDRVTKIDNQLQEINEEFNSYKDTEYKQNIPKEAYDFAERNKDWFNQDSIDNIQLMKLASEFESVLQSKYPNLSIEERLNLVEKSVKSSKLYGATINEAKHQRPSDVTFSRGENSSGNRTSKKITFSDLPFKEQQYVNNIYRISPQLAKSISKDEYAQQLFEDGGIKNER